MNKLIGILVFQSDEKDPQNRADEKRLIELHEALKFYKNDTVDENGPADKLPDPLRDIELYLDNWNKDEKYSKQETLLRKLFLTSTSHENKNRFKVFLKVGTLNSCYSAGLSNITAAVDHILSIKDFDKRITDPSSCAVDVVDELARIPIPHTDNETRDCFSFATKYCSHHDKTGEKFAIMDQYALKMLSYFDKRDQFIEKTNGKGSFKTLNPTYVGGKRRKNPKKYFPRFQDKFIRVHGNYKEIIERFRYFYKLDRRTNPKGQHYTLKEIDRYLWQSGKLHTVANSRKRLQKTKNSTK